MDKFMELYESSIGEVSKMLTDGKVVPSDILASYKSRFTSLEGRINAFLTDGYDAAEIKAKAMDSQAAV